MEIKYAWGGQILKELTDMYMYVILTIKVCQYHVFVLFLIITYWYILHVLHS